VSLLFWIPILPFTQHEQYLRYEVEENYKSDRFAEALQVMAAHKFNDFPPHWDPPPRISFRRGSFDLYMFLDLIEQQPNPTPWVREVYTQKLVDSIDYVGLSLKDYGLEELQLIASVLEKIPTARAAFRARYGENAQNLTFGVNTPDEIIERFQKIAQFAEQEAKTENDER